MSPRTATKEGICCRIWQHSGSGSHARHSCKVKAEIMHGQGGSAHSSEQVEVDELTVSGAGYPS
eukprot:3954774-Amphidinium_carterae.1